MRKSLIFTVMLSISLFANYESSSIDIPFDKHLKYTLGNQNNHPTIKNEGERYFASLAKISSSKLKETLEKNGFYSSSISLEDKVRQLVYKVYAKDKYGNKYKIYVDAGNGSILEKQKI